MTESFISFRRCAWHAGHYVVGLASVTFTLWLCGLLFYIWHKAVPSTLKVSLLGSDRRQVILRHNNRRVHYTHKCLSSAEEGVPYYLVNSTFVIAGNGRWNCFSYTQLENRWSITLLNNEPGAATFFLNVKLTKVETKTQTSRAL